mgnify:CR=1 FL=1
MSFLHPHFFWLLFLIPTLILFYFFVNKKTYSNISFSSLSKANYGLKAHLYPFLFFLRIVTVVFLIIALARPQTTDVSVDTIKKEGIDIMIAMDVSSSMLAEDFKPNRIEAAKELAIDFIQRRKNDRIGLVIYSGESFTQCPLTTDHDILINMMNNVDIGLIEDGTAIGLGLANCVNRLKDSTTESKIVILLTDGENNTGFIDPITAASIARENSIKAYTIGVGSYGSAPYPTKDMFGRSIYVDVPANIDEDMLRLVADTTGGNYFRADKKSQLAEIYKEIESLEKSEIEELKFYNVTEKYFIYCLIALISFFLEIMLDYSFFKKIV